MGDHHACSDRGSDCEQALRELDHFLANEVSDDSRAAIAKHLDGCVDCLQAYDFHAELRAVIATKCHNDDLPHGLLDRLEQCLELGSSSAEQQPASDPPTG